jgi:hypothetical protein
MTDGVVEHSDGDRGFAPGLLEETIRRTKHLSSREIVAAIRHSMVEFAPVEDDASLVVIKRTR